jgi:hypothetical protein
LDLILDLGCTGKLVEATEEVDADVELPSVVIERNGRARIDSIRMMIPIKTRSLVLRCRNGF